MSTKGQEARERLKQEYKEHYQKIKEAKVRLKQTEKKSKIAQALGNMNADDLLESVDEFLGKVRNRINFSEAKLDVAMDSLNNVDKASDLDQKENQETLEQEIKKQKARDTLNQLKAEMGMLYSDIEKTTEQIHSQKTIGTKKADIDSKNDKTAK